MLPRAGVAPAEFARLMAGMTDERVHFMCHGCIRIRRMIRIMVFGGLVAVVLAIVALKQIGII